MKELEFERKFIVTSLQALPFDLSKCKKKTIYQGFYSGLPSPLRIRRINDHYTLTKKFVLDSNKNHLEEVTLPIKKSEFKILYPVAYKKIIKTRYDITWNKYKIELDVFKGKLKGLIVAEIEFPSPEAMENFAKPNFLGPEITSCKWATNSRLALTNYQKVKKYIERLC
jgi:CYTH domain-containing protein